jgi:hypothetical protein
LASTEHIVGQAVPTQPVNSPQLVAAPAGLQAPVPLQSGAGVTEEGAPAVPGVQTAAPQGVVLGQSWQAPVPLQLPEAPQVFIAVAVQLLCGSVPDTTSPHTPSMP